MVQTVRTLFHAYGISGQMIRAGMKVVPNAAVYVGMVESTIKRIPKNIGLVIIDEAHNLSFAKMFDHFKEQLIIGFTATPLTSSKTKALKNYYEDIVCGIDIPELISGGSLCQNITYAPKDTVDAAKLKVKAGEYDDKMIVKYFLKPDESEDFYTTSEIKNELELHTKDKININKLGGRLRKLGYERFKKYGVYGYKISKTAAKILGNLPLPGVSF